MSTFEQQQQIEEFWKEFVIKTSTIILNNRISWSHEVKRKKSSLWFHFDSEENEEVLQKMNTIFKQFKAKAASSQTSVNTNLYVDIFVDGIHKTAPYEHTSSVLLERWTLSFDYQKRSSSSKNTTAASHELSAAFTKATVMMRSLYSYSILLPAYKVYRRQQRFRSTEHQLKYFISNVEPTSETSAFEQGSSLRYEFPTISLNSHTVVKLSVQYRKNINFSEFSMEKSRKLVIPNVDDDYFNKLSSSPIAAMGAGSFSQKPPLSSSQSDHSNKAASYTQGGKWPSKLQQEDDDDPNFQFDDVSPMPRQRSYSTNTFPSSSQKTQPINIPGYRPAPVSEVKKRDSMEDAQKTPPLDFLPEQPSSFARIASSTGSSIASSLENLSSISPPFSKEYMDQFSSSWKKKDFKLSFSPLNDTPLSYHPRSASASNVLLINHENPEKSISESFKLERHPSIPSIFQKPAEMGGIAGALAGNTNAVSSTSAPEDGAPATSSSNSNSNSGVLELPPILNHEDDDVMKQFIDLGGEFELDNSHLAFAKHSAEAETEEGDDIGLFLEQIRNAPKIKAFSQQEAVASLKTWNTMVQDLKNLQTTHDELFGKIKSTIE